MNTWEVWPNPFRLLERLLGLALRGLPTVVLVLLLTACAGQVNWQATPDAPTNGAAAGTAGGLAAGSPTPAVNCPAGYQPASAVDPRIDPDTCLPIPTPAPAPAGVDSVCGPGEHPYTFADGSGYYCAP